MLYKNSLPSHWSNKSWLLLERICKEYYGITISVYTFLVDPPSFENNLETFNVDRWSDYSLVLPKIIDPNDLNCIVSINSPIPDWIKLENNTLLLNTIGTKFNILETTVITLKITNEQKSWREYNQTIIISMYLKPLFSIIEHIDILMNSIVEVDVYIEYYHKVDAIDWYNNLPISWIIISSDHSKMYINSANVLEQLKWAKLRSYDSWNNIIYSNSFSISINSVTHPPPSISNTFGPLKVYIGEKSLFLIPYDLFYSNSDKRLRSSASVFHWSNNSTLKIGIDESDLLENNYLYIFSNEAKSCVILINAEDKYYEMKRRLNIGF